MTKPKRKIDTDAFKAEAEELLNGNGYKMKHTEVFQEILENLKPIDFRELGEIDEDQKVTQKLQVVLTIQNVLQVANDLNCGLCRNQDFIYSYNGEFWHLTDRNELESFLGEASEKCSVHWTTARHHQFRTELYKQFVATAYLPKPKVETDNVLINLKNGTFDINGNGQNLRSFNRNDFLTYQLDFEMTETATCPKWQVFLDKVLPEKEKQKVLAEYLGYIFARHLKLEKTLILFGTGANGKSVVHDVITALFGKENISHYSLEALGVNYFRAMIANKLLNYSSDISYRLKAEIFKQLTSGEPVEARLPYGQPMTLTNYARLMFNSNELPKDVEHTNAFFRRFLIMPFDVTIPESEQNKNLAKEIIEAELSGVFNWILEGLQRLLEQGNFTPCEAIDNALKLYRQESDSATMFIEDENYEKSVEDYTLIKHLYQDYKLYCSDNGYKPLVRKNFSKRLESNGYFVDRRNVGLVINLIKA
ncbi:MAG: DNA primase family protein [Aridibacter sp.]